MAFSPNGSKVAFVHGNVNLFRVSDGGLLWRNSEYPWNASNIAYSGDGSTIAAAESYLSSFRITMRRETNGAIFQTITNLTNAVITLTFSTSNQVISLTRDGAVTFWQTNGIPARTFNVKTGLVCAAFSFGADALAVGYNNRRIELIRLSDGMVEQTFVGHSNLVLKVALSSDGAMLFSAATNELLLWRVADAALLRRYTEEILSPAALAVSPHGDSFALGRADANILVAKKPDFFLPPANPINGELVLQFSGESGITYTVQASPDSRTWAPWTNIPCPGPPALFRVSSASSNSFYRLAR